MDSIARFARFAKHTTTPNTEDNAPVAYDDHPRKRTPPPPAEPDSAAMFAEFRKTKDPAVRETLVLQHRDLAVYFARRFRDRGEPLEDLIQVAMIGLIKTVDRFDPARGVRFGTYAAATIVGELQRHFRDKVWAIRVPRPQRELHHRLLQAVETLWQRLGRSPTIEELTVHTGIPFDVTIEALEASRAYTPMSLDGSDRTEDEVGTRLEYIGETDPAIEHAEDVLALRGAWTQLSERERAVLEMRFHEDLPQDRIAERLNVSQMEISRILRRALLRLRHLIGE